jgi:hypothetical protein
MTVKTVIQEGMLAVFPVIQIMIVEPQNHKGQEHEAQNVEQ